MLRLEVGLFRQVTVISEGLRDRLGLNGSHVHLLPLGADRTPAPPRSFDDLHLVYIGTLEHREIHKTIEGFTAFCEDMGSGTRSTYDLLGNGPAYDREMVLKAIGNSSQRERIRFHGRVPVTALQPFLLSCNVGVTFIPRRDHYDVQPSTKMFEYLLAGLPVLATRTSENMRVVTAANGVLCDDTAESFREGLHAIWDRRTMFDDAAIRDSVAQYEWGGLIGTYLRPLLDRLADEPGRQR